MKKHSLLFRQLTFVPPALACLVVIGGLTLPAQTTNAPAATVSTSTASSSDSLVSNSDFELATKNAAWPDDWPRSTGVTYEVENGKHYLHIVAQKPDQHLMEYREIEIPPGVKNLIITIRYRTTNVVPGTEAWFDARAIFHFMDASRKNVPPDPAVMRFEKTTLDWTTASEPCTVPDKAVKLILMPSLFKVDSGTLDLAEVTVTGS